MFGPKILMSPTGDGGGGPNEGNESLGDAKRYLEMQEKIEDSKKRQLEIDKALAEENANLYKTLGDNAKAYLEIHDIRKREADLAIEHFRNQKNLNKLLEEGGDVLKEFEKIAGRKLTDDEKELALMENKADFMKTAKKFYKERQEADGKRKITMENSIKLSGKIAEKMGITGAATESWVMDLMKGNLGLKEAFDRTFSLENIFANVVSTAVTMALEIDNAAKALGKATGMGDQFQNQLLAVQSNTIAMGGSIEDASKATEAMITNFSAFNPRAKATNEYMATNIVLLGTIGVSGGDAAKSMDFFTRAMGKSAKAATDMTRNIAMMGKNMGVTASKMVSDFQSVSGDIAMYGDRMEGVFKNLAAQAKATGMSVSSLVNLGKQFDTFDKAADTTAKLNAVLGTSLSTVDMMNMSYDERIKYLQQELRSVGANMDSMDPYTKMYIAQSLGVKDVAEAQRLLNMSQGEMAKNKRLQEEANTRQEKLKELTTELVPIMDQMKIAFAQVALALEPVVRIGMGLLLMVTDLNAAFGGVLIPMIIGGIAVFKTYQAVTSTILGIKQLYLIATKATTAAEMVAKGVTAAGLTVKYADTAASIAQGTATQFLAQSFGKLLLKGLLVVGLLMALAAAFHYSQSPALYLIAGVMAIGVFLLARSLDTMGPAASYGAGVLMLVAVAMGIMFGTMTMLIHSVVLLFDTLVGSLAQIPQVVLGIYSIAGAITVLAASSILALIPIMAIFGIMSGLGAVLLGLSAMTGGVVLAGLGSSLMEMGTGMEKFATGLSTVSKMASKMSAAAGDGFLAISSDGAGASAVIGSGDVMKNFVDGKITVDVNIPEMKMPETTVNVYLDGKKLEGVVQKVIAEAG